MKNYLNLIIILASIYNYESIFARNADEIAESLRTKKLVLSIGINSFSNSDWRPLRYAEKDAKNVYESFIDSNVGFDGGLLLTQTANKRSVTRHDVFRALEKLNQTAKNEDDMVVVYISSHGTVGYKDDGSIGRYIITSETDPQNLSSTAIDYDKLIEKFESLKSRKKVLILAFCHSGVGKSVLTPQMKRALANYKSAYFDEPVQERSEGTIILTASGWKEPALEDSRLKNDVYTHFLLKGLGEDQNGDGAVSITEAHTFASNMTYSYTKGRQRPSAIMELLGADPMIVSGKLNADSRASLYSLMGRFSNLLVSVDGKNLGAIEKGLVVPEGKVRLTIKDPKSQDVIADRVVNFEAGREYSISNYLAPSLPHNIFVGAHSLNFFQESVRDGYAPTSLLGPSIQYRRDEAISIYDLSLNLQHIPEVNESIKTDRGEKIQQTRQTITASLNLGLRNRIRSLSFQNSLRSEFKMAAGPAALLMKRVVSEEAYYEVEQISLVGGLNLLTGVDFILPYHLVKFSLDAEVKAFKNFTNEGGPLTAAGTLSLSVGTFW